MKMSEDERQCLSESRGGSANVISIFSYCARRYLDRQNMFTAYRLFTVYCLPAVYVVMRYFHRNLDSVAVPYVVRKKSLFWEIHVGYEQKKLLWGCWSPFNEIPMAINESIQGCPN